MGQSISLAHLAPFIQVSRNKIHKDVLREVEELHGELDEEVISNIVERRLREEIKRGVQIIQYQVVTLMTTNGQAPFVTVFMYLNEAKNATERRDLAMIIEETLRQRYEGVKNEAGVWITPAFPKLIYVLEEDNIEKGSEYYYLTELAAKCTAKRLVPDYISEKKMKELKEGNCFPVMGCVDGQELITYVYKDKLYVESFERMWMRIAPYYPIQHSQNGTYVNSDDLFIYDTKKGFVSVKHLIRNTSKDWYKITTSGGRVLLCTNDHPLPTGRGRVFAENLVKGDTLSANYNQYHHEHINYNTNRAWLMGFILCDGNTQSELISSIGLDETDIESHYISVIKEQFELDTKVVTRHRDKKGNYKDLVSNKSSKICDYINTQYEGSIKMNKHIPNEVFSWNKQARLAFLAGVIDADGYINNITSKVQIGSKNKELALQQMALVQTLDIPAYVYENHYSSEHPERIHYRIEFTATSELISYVISKKKRNHYTQTEIASKSIETVTITKIVHLDNYENYSYDVTTESDHFEVSGLYSHNCRSCLSPWKDENGNYKFYGRSIAYLGRP